MKNNKRTIVIIVPHQDDELNIVGPLIPTLHHKGFYIVLLFTTNGDYFPNYEKRRKEAAKVAKLIGIDEIVYLGYPDSGPNINDNNIYNCEGTYIANNGRSHTVGFENQNEYCYEKHQLHRSLTRDNMFLDLKEFIIDNNPYVVFCIDYDKHPDHRIASLLVDEAMMDISKNINPMPIYLKGFSYIGNWFGDYDYFNRVPLPTINIISGKKSNPIPYSWKDRISIGINPALYPTFYWRSSLYRAYRKYKSQKAYKHFFRCANTDKAFWHRDFSNVCFDAKLFASSGNVSFLNDGKLIDSNNVRLGSDYELEKTWHPDEKDTNNTIDIVLKKPTKYLRINIYMSIIPFASTTIIVKNKYFTYSSALRDYVVSFDVKESRFFKSFTIKFISIDNKSIYVSEIELFDNDYQDKRMKDFLSLFPKYNIKKRSRLALLIVFVLNKINFLLTKIFRKIASYITFYKK